MAPCIPALLTAEMMNVRSRAGLLSSVGSAVIADNGDFQSVPQDKNNLRGERGSGVSDLRQRLVASWTYALPFWSRNRFAGGWQLNGVANLYTGLPLTPISSINTLNGSGTQRPDRIGSGVSSNPTVQRWFDITAFTMPAPYRFGNSGRDILY